MKRFVLKYLDPASRLGEILFGLIMVLTITLTAGLTVSEDQDGVRQLLFAAIGCNIAWGIIDAVMYVMDCLTLRAGSRRLIQALQNAPNEEEALVLIQNEIRPEFQDLLSPTESAGLSRSILGHLGSAGVPKPAKLTKDDIYGAIACFWLVLISCLPAAIPFLIFSRPHLALRISNLFLIILLFLVGQKWAQYTGTHRVGTGLAMVAIGLILVGVAIPLGG